MTRRHWHEPQTVGVEGLPMFAQEPASASPRPERPPTGLELGIEARNATAAKHGDTIARLVPIARELAAKAGLSGVTVSDLRITAVQRGILTGCETGRALSYLGSVMEAAGLERTAGFRRSVIERSHGNLNRIFVVPGGSTARNRDAGAA